MIDIIHKCASYFDEIDSDRIDEAWSDACIEGFGSTFITDENEATSMVDRAWARKNRISAACVARAKNRSMLPFYNNGY